MCDDEEGCEKLKKEVRAHSKDFLLISTDKVLNYLEKLKERVESSKNFDEDLKAEQLARIEESIADKYKSK